MKAQNMQKGIMMLVVLGIVTLACATVGGTTSEVPPTPDAISTILAEVERATQNAVLTQAVVEPVVPTAQGETAVVPDNTEDAAATAEPTSAIVTVNTPTPAAVWTNTPGIYPTAIPLPNPQASNFYTCLSNCASDGSNHQTTFPEKTEVIYFQFAFSEFPVGAPYSRAWYKDGMEWVRYDCYWQGPESGIDQITLTDPLGLPSGTWTLVVTINGVQVLNKTLTINGTWNQWTPPGHFNSCYGKR